VPAAASDVTGARIAGYTLVRRLGGGGMGEVYLAERAGAGGFVRPVALKVMRDGLGEDPRAVSRFQREGRVLGALHHRNVVQVFELDIADGQLFLAMEYLHGVTLRRLSQERGALAWPLVAFIGAEVARGLEAAHALRLADAPRGLVHRDLSPSNVMACVDGGVKILDFGLARPADAEPSVSGIEGKLPYLAPELVAGFGADAAADIYALGVVLYELLTGRPLFRGGNELETMHRVLHEVVPPPSRIAAGVPPELDAIVLRSLARDRGVRFTAAAEVVAALESALGGRAGAPALALEVHAAMGQAAIAEPVAARSFSGERITRSEGPSATAATVNDRPPARAANRAQRLAIARAVAAASVATALWILRSPTPEPVVVQQPVPSRAVAVPDAAPAPVVVAPAPQPPPVRPPRARRTARVQDKKPAEPARPPGGGIAPGLIADPFAGDKR
jgi:hypothetical protein